MPRFTAVLCVTTILASSLAAQAGYDTDFEALVASAAGTIITGQDGYYLPVTSPVSIDGLVCTYAGNTFGIPANPLGGVNFWIGASNGTNFARSQRTITVPSGCQVLIEYDVCVGYTGSVTPVNNIGSFSFQPSTTARFPNLLAAWPTGVVFPPTGWNANVVLGPTVAGAQTTFPDPNFLNLPLNVWHRWGCVIDLGINEYVQFKLTNGSTNVTTIYTPAPGTMQLPNPTGTFPTDFRLFGGGGAGNLFAIDNLTITYYGGYTAYAAGCAGTAGVPTLGAAAGSRPALGTTFTAQLGNLPLSLAIICTGFSDTSALGGSLPLPFALTGFGMPGCSLLADPVATTFLVGAGGTATWSLALPGNTSYLGMLFFNQGFSLDPTANPGGIAVSNGGRACIGR